MVKNNTTFVKITNQNIYDKLGAMMLAIDRIEQHAIETNGKVKLNRVLAGVAITISLAAVGIIKYI